MIYLLIIFYLLAIIVANIIVYMYGQVALVFTAFILIPFDLVSRDFLHEYWNNSGYKLWLKMLILIMSGSILTFIINYNTKYVALASLIAFMCSGFINLIIYHLLKNKRRIIKMTISNCFAAITDSLLFPLIAFGVIDYYLSLTQAIMKVLGGIFWILLIIMIFRIIKSLTKKEYKYSYLYQNYFKKVNKNNEKITR